RDRCDERGRDRVRGHVPPGRNGSIGSPSRRAGGVGAGGRCGTRAGRGGVRARGAGRVPPGGRSVSTPRSVDPRLPVRKIVGPSCWGGSAVYGVAPTRVSDGMRNTSAPSGSDSMRTVTVDGAVAGGATAGAGAMGFSAGTLAGTGGGGAGAAGCTVAAL